ncbi:mhyt domain-containing signaling protein [Stemphylium lycopersici]|nr:mhyt domain-containing signaling protein [Stemphylium lycopersici]
MLNSEIQTKYPLGSRPTISFVPYLIFCSYLVSLIGAFTTVELLHRRVSGAGWRSWIQIGGCAVSFGLVAIWCMHFVGNRAIVLGDGEDEIQLYYSPTYTAVSAILPVVVIFLGLLAADKFYKGSRGTIVRFASLAVCGVCGGAAVTEMHYLGNNGTTNYRIILSWRHVVGAAAIAVGACLVSFGLFFHWSKHWMNNIWRRIVVAFVLALAVCGMHWTAAAGTWYEIRGYHDGPGQERNTNLIISLCLCLSACAVCFLLGFIKQRQRRLEKNRAQQVVLAVATFDPEGRLLVSQSGLMPCQTITQQFHRRTFDDEFNTSHPVFQWIFKVSRNWAGIAELIPSMREHLQSTGFLQAPTQANSSRDSTDGDADSSYSATFRELFCITAHEIAKTLDMSLQNLGCLYEDVLTTGTLMNRAIWTGNYGSKAIMAVDVATNDVEAGTASPILFGKGQMLVLTRKIDTTEAHRLQNLGYGFAGIEQVSDHLARSLQIPRDDLESLVGRLHAFSERECSMPRKGTYLASFILQPKPGMRGLDVIVPRANRGRLPMVKLDDDELNGRELGILCTFDGLTLNECLARINQRTKPETPDDIFTIKFGNRIMDLLQDCPEEALRLAVFSAQQLDLTHGQTELSQATVFAFCGIKEIYVQSLQSPTLKTISLSFFQTYLRSQPGCVDHAILAQRNHKEFSSLQRVPSTPKTTSSHGPKWPWRLRSKRSASTDISWNADTCSEKGLVNSTTSNSPTEIPTPTWGGIMVTSTQDIRVVENKDGANMAMHDLGVRAKVGMAETEQPTLADRLMAITTALRDPHAARQPGYHGSRK